VQPAGAHLEHPALLPGAARLPARPLAREAAPAPAGLAKPRPGGRRAELRRPGGAAVAGGERPMTAARFVVTRSRGGTAPPPVPVEALPRRPAASACGGGGASPAFEERLVLVDGVEIPPEAIAREM